ILLLGAGAAHADDTLAPGQLDDPTSGPNQSLQLDTHGERIDTSAATNTEAGRRTTAASLSGQQIPDVLRGLPLSTVLPTSAVGLPRTTSSKLPGLPGVPTTEGSLSSLPLIGGMAGLDQLGLPGTDTLQGTSIADTRTAFPQTPAPPESKNKRPPTR